MSHETCGLWRTLPRRPRPGAARCAARPGGRCRADHRPRRAARTGGLRPPHREHGRDSPPPRGTRRAPPRRATGLAGPVAGRPPPGGLPSPARGRRQRCQRDTARPVRRRPHPAAARRSGAPGPEGPAADPARAGGGRRGQGGPPRVPAPGSGAAAGGAPRVRPDLRGPGQLVRPPRAPYRRRLPEPGRRGAAHRRGRPGRGVRHGKGTARRDPRQPPHFGTAATGQANRPPGRGTGPGPPGPRPGRAPAGAPRPRRPTPGRSPVPGGPAGSGFPRR